MKSHTPKHASLGARIASLAIRHGIASVVTVAIACAVWTITYVALLLWAIVSNGGLGGPLAYPAGILFVAGASAVACLVFFFPATATAEWICRIRALPIFAQIPVSVAVLGALCSLAGIALRVTTKAMPFGVSAGAFIVWLFAVSLLPIGFYWWIAQAGPLLLRVINALRASEVRQVRGA